MSRRPDGTLSTYRFGGYLHGVDTKIAILRGGKDRLFPLAELQRLLDCCVHARGGPGEFKLRIETKKKAIEMVCLDLRGIRAILERVRNDLDRQRGEKILAFARLRKVAEAYEAPSAGPEVVIEPMESDIQEESMTAAGRQITPTRTFTFPVSQTEVRQFTREDGMQCFIAPDACRALEIKDTWNALRRLDEDEKGTVTISTPGGPQDVTYVTEPGLYALILTSRQERAKAFKRWVTHEVLPEIRRTGSYSAKSAQAEQPTGMSPGDVLESFRCQLLINSQHSGMIQDAHKRIAAHDEAIQQLAARVEQAEGLKDRVDTLAKGLVEQAHRRGKPENPLDGYLPIWLFAEENEFRLGQHETSELGKFLTNVCHHRGTVYQGGAFRSRAGNPVNGYPVSLLVEMIEHFRNFRGTRPERAPYVPWIAKRLQKEREEQTQTKLFS